MGTRPKKSPGESVRCRLLLLTFVFLVCVCLLMAMAATDAASLGPNDAATAADMTTTGSPARYSGGSGSTAGADAFRSSKRRIPKGPDPIHNRRAGKTTIAPRRRD
ncbi:uncharacterized protein LOC133885762 [Phragmites australis]|uniref:uncharacterized protein LOC133885762 n=1 Tax=Phragmites australis TaxID=29695 RepID=UPI002D772D0A|nr:uncharacterized protein LOC133885762 [Phragmites australis]